MLGIRRKVETVPLRKLFNVCLKSRNDKQYKMDPTPCRVRKPKFKAILKVAKIQHQRKSRTNPRRRLSVTIIKQSIFRKGIKWKRSSWLEQPQEFIFSGGDIITHLNLLWIFGTAQWDHKRSRWFSSHESCWKCILGSRPKYKRWGGKRCSELCLKRWNQHSFLLTLALSSQSILTSRELVLLIYQV